MRILVAAVALSALLACTQPPPPQALPSATPLAPPPSAQPAESELAAPEPMSPTLAQFRRQAALACAAARTTIVAAPLRGDPLRAGARPRDVKAGIAHFRATASAYTTAAGQLWEFGLPRQPLGQRLVTALDTTSQYNQQAADYLTDGDEPSAEAALGAAHAALEQANRITQRLQLGRLEDCGRAPGRLPGARQVQVTATDFGFNIGAVARGKNSFVLRNEGAEDHQLTIVPLRAPGTLSAAIRADREGDRPGAFLAGEGVATPVTAPGARGRVDVRLMPGLYGLICFVASPDGTPHAYKGMASELTVGG